MLGIPALGARVQVWPAPGRRVQFGDRPLDSGGRWMRASGEYVVWSPFCVEQLRAGDIFLHNPTPPAAAKSATETKTAPPAKAADAGPAPTEAAHDALASAAAKAHPLEIEPAPAPVTSAGATVQPASTGKE